MTASEGPLGIIRLFGSQRLGGSCGGSCLVQPYGRIGHGREVALAELCASFHAKPVPTTSLIYTRCIWVRLLTMWQLPGAKTVAFGHASASAPS
jgi:hypothetical protein